MRKEPAVWISLIGAVLMLAVGFGLKLSGVQTEQIMNLAAILVPLILGGTAVAIRSQVYNADSVQTALNMPAGANVPLLDKVLETGVTVTPGDTKAEVREKVAEATRASG